MAVVKISELPAMQTIAGSDVLPIVDTSETETKKVTKQMLLTDINAEEVKIGQLTEATQINDEDYLIITQNGTNKKISKANAKFASGDEVYVGDTEPTGEDDDSVKFWIEPSEDSVDAEGTYISNEYGIAQDKGYSQEYANKNLIYSTSEQDTGKKWIDGKPIYRKVIETNFTTQLEITRTLSSLGLQNIETVIELNSFLQGNPIEQDYYANDSDKLRTLIDPTGLIVLVGATYPARPCTVYTIIEYTKTTD